MGSPVQGGSTAGTTYAVPPVVLGGIDAGGVVRTLLTDSTGRIAVTATSPLAAGLGVQFEPYPATVGVAETAPTTQNVFGIAVYGTAGASITGIMDRCAVAAAGTNPTTVRFGLTDNTGKILALSGNYGSGGTNNAVTIFATGANPIPFSAPFVLAYTGIYFPVMLVNGTWGTTQPLLVNSHASHALSMAAYSTNPPPAFAWTGQTDLPALGSSVTMTGGSSERFWLALY